MITEAFRHCRGIGPARITQLHDAGLRTWHDVLATPESVPGNWRSTLVQVCRQSRQALAERDIQYFLGVFPAADRWRILAHFFGDATFFDIETTGLEFDATITVVTAWHRGQLLTFVEHENLDDFLNLLDEVQLLVSFNGCSFDVPRVISGFHIPELPCPHLDLRWSCHHRGLSGSLKHIANTLGIRRPADLDDVDGAVAVALWHDWIASGNRAARDHLVRYCCADVLLLLLVAQQVCDINDIHSNCLWQQLPPAPDGRRRVPDSPQADVTSLAKDGSNAALPDLQPQTSAGNMGVDRQAMVASLFGHSSPGKLRTLRRRNGQ